MTDITFRDLQKGLRDLGLTASSRVVVHASLSAFGHVRGGAEALAGALTAACGLVVVPAFTPQCQIWPLVGPADNGLTYTDRQAENAEAELFTPDLPAHADMGITADRVRQLPGALRSTHPLLSFAALGLGAEEVLAAQTLAEPLGLFERLAALGSDVLLLGVDHTKNTALHAAEARAGRKQFTRWALTPPGVLACPGIPGCSEGFNAFAPRLAAVTRTAQIGGALAQRLPLTDLLALTDGWLRADPLAGLCARSDCERCQAVRKSQITA